MLSSMGALIVEGIVLAPAAVLVVLVLGALPIAAATVVAIIATDAYGIVIWLVGRRVTANLAASRLPELLDAVAPRHAA
jgi:type IV secretory pathway TrbD component